MKSRKVDILAFVLLLFSVFYSINSDIINQNDNDILYPVTYFFRARSNEIAMERLIGPPTSGEDGNKKHLYLLVLDRSMSLTWRGNFPGWYNDTINTLNRRTDLNFNRYIDGHSGSDLCKMNLFQVLLDIENHQADFAVLKVGDETRKIYPVEINRMYCEANTGNILGAICHIESITRHNEELNTDFKCLFTRVFENYINSLSITNHPDGLPLVKLIVISDLIHDVKDKLENELKENHQYNLNHLRQRLQENKKQLINIIRQLLSSELLVSIVITRGALERQLMKHEIYIWEFLDKKNRKFPPQKIPIEKYSYLSLMYSVRAEDAITFYHPGDKYVQEETFFIIENDRFGNYKMSLDIPPKNNKYPRGKMKFHILKADQKPSEHKGKSGYLNFSGEITELRNVEEKQYIQLSYSGEIPPQDEITFLNFYVPGENRKFFSIPIYFKKTFTTFNVILVLLLYLYIILYVVYYLFHIRNLSFLVQGCKGILFSIKNIFK